MNIPSTLPLLTQRQAALLGNLRKHGRRRIAGADVVVARVLQSLGLVAVTFAPDGSPWAEASAPEVG